MYKTLKITHLRLVSISNISALISAGGSASVMTDRLSDQSGASLREPLLVVSIRSEQTIHTSPEPTIHFTFFFFYNFPSIHLFTAAFLRTSQLPLSAMIADTVDLNM